MSAAEPITARHVETGRWMRLEIQGASIAKVGTSKGPEAIGPEDPWVAPALWDIQTNGRLGVSFSDPSLTVEQVVDIVRAQAALGVARLCPTLITAPEDALRHGLATIARACEVDRAVAHQVVGIHLEGPFLSPEDGYRGAHPLEAIRDPDWGLFRSLQEAADGRIALVTLAPERPGALDLIRRLTESGVTVALGHSAAGPATIREAVEAGATLSTHLGNGLAATLPRHPNPIWTQAAEDRLFASLIADGHHLDDDVLRVLVRAKGPERVVLVSDASPLAGLPPGAYGPWAVEPSGRVVVAGTPYLAGANRPLGFGVDRLIQTAGLSIAQAIACATRQPARVLGRPEPRLEPGAPADLIRFQLDQRRFHPTDAWVLGHHQPIALEPEPQVTTAPV